MAKTDLPLEEAIRQLRPMLPANTATAQAIDQHEPWELVAIKAIDDGYISAVHEFDRFVGACVRCGTR